MFLMSCQNQEENVIKIHPDKVISENFIGNGVQWSAYPHADSEEAEWGLLMTEEKWNRVYDRLDYMQPRFVRVIDQANWRYLKGFDKNNNPIIDYDTQEEKALENILTYCQKNTISVMLGEWGCPYQVHDVDAGFSGIFKGANDPEWIKIIVGHLNYLINTKGYTCIDYFNLVNEPNGFWASTDGRYDEWSEGVKLLSKAIEEAGLSDQITIAGPDAVAHYDHPNRKPSAVDWVMKTADELNDQIGALEIHAYFKPEIIRENQFRNDYQKFVDKAKEIGKPILFGEVGFDKSVPENLKRIAEDPYASEDSHMSVYDYSYGIDMANALIQIMNTGFHGAAAWDLDDAMHTKGDLGEKHQLKRWGMWNSLGTELCDDPSDEEIRPYYFTWSLMCRYIQPQSNIITSDVKGYQDIKTVVSEKEGEYTLAILNTGAEEVALNLDFKEIQSEQLQQFLYQENNLKTDFNGFPLPMDKSFKLNKGKKTDVIIPANSFMLLTTFDY